MTLRIDTILMVVVLAGGGMVGAQPTNSLYRRAEQEQQARTIRGRVSESGTAPMAAPAGRQIILGRDSTALSASKTSWITVAKPRPKDVRLHDLVTIVVHEVSKHTSKSDAKAEREYSIDAKLADWLRLTGGNLRPDRQSRGDPAVSLSFEREFDSKGDIKREDTLSARIQAEIIDVFPNGNLLLEATHKVTTDDETTTITLSGICRSKDVGIDNSILSNQLARLDIRKEHTGVMRDATKRGLLSGLLDWLAPF